jgi:uncharacterized membrane protein YedE/YeeE
VTTTFTPGSGLAGGILIGLSAVLLMASAGRIAGASGIFGGLVSMRFGRSFTWQMAFVLGLMAGAAFAIAAGLFDPAAIILPAGPVATVVAGLLVGVGTNLGSGCTSGHGICGMSRLSVRSIAATIVFVAVGMFTVAALHLSAGI